jgi:hypothetical protein
LQNEVLLSLLEHISVKNIKVACAAADGIALLAEAFPKLRAFDADFIMLIIEKVIWSISDHLISDEKSKLNLRDVAVSCTIVSRLFRILLEWLMVVPSQFVSNPNVSLRITEAIEETIHASLSGLEFVVEAANQNKESNTTDNNLLEIQQLYHSMKESAENTLIHLFHHVDNFGPPFGVAMMNSQINDYLGDEKMDMDNHHYLAINNHTIVGFIDVPEQQKVRILIRDPAGKFTWDMKYFYDLDKDIDESQTCSFQQQAWLGQRPLPSYSKHDGFSTESIGVIKADDVLDLALTRFNSEHPECVYRKGVVEATNEFDVQYQQDINDHVAQEKCLPARTSDRKQLPAKPLDEYFPFENARLLLSQMGFLSFDYLKEGTVHMLTKSPALFRDIKGLDKKPS